MILGLGCGLLHQYSGGYGWSGLGLGSGLRSGLGLEWY